MTANRISVNGYLTEIFVLQFLHRPFWISQLMMGISSTAVSVWPQLGQWLRPDKKDSPWTIRHAAQFKNEPIHAPRQMATTIQYTNMNWLSNIEIIIYTPLSFLFQHKSPSRCYSSEFSKKFWITFFRNRNILRPQNDYFMISIYICSKNLYFSFSNILFSYFLFSIVGTTMSIVLSSNAEIKMKVERKTEQRMKTEWKVSARLCWAELVRSCHAKRCKGVKNRETSAK